MQLITPEDEIADNAVTSSLLDGARVLLRQLKPADAPAVSKVHESLDDDERYLRFFTPHPSCLAHLIEMLTEGRSDGYAIGAFESGTLVGVASYALCGKPETADVSVVVAHDNHDRGIGTLMLRRLAQVARSRGIRRLVADVLANNHRLFKVLSDAGLRPCELGASNGVVHLEVDVPELAPALDEC